VRSIGGAGGEAAVPCEAVEEAALRGRASGRIGRNAQLRRSGVGDVAGVANVGRRRRRGEGRILCRRPCRS
jgi:hypothetical protein